jgi:PST family polysaccharide transporter
MNDSPDVTHSLDTQNLRSRSIRGGSVMAIAQVCKLVLIFASQVFLSRLLNVEAFGLIAMVGPVLGFVQIFVDLGLMQSVTQRQEITARQLSAVFWASILFAVTISLFMMLMAPALAWIYKEPRIFPVTIALASLIAINGLSLVQGAFLARRLRFGTLAFCEVLSLFLGIPLAF